MTEGSGILVDNSDSQVVMNNGISNVAVDGIALTTTQEGGHGCTGCQILLNGDRDRGTRRHLASEEWRQLGRL